MFLQYDVTQIFPYKTDLLFVLFLGLIAALGFPPYTAVELTILSFSLFMALLFLNMKQAILYGFMFGLGQFLFAYSWLITSMTEYSTIPEITAIIIYIVVCAEVAFFPALFAYLISKIKTNHYWVLVLLVPSTWVLTEWLRSNIVPFAWNLIGYTFYPYKTILQLSDIGGVYLLSWLLVFVATFLTLLILNKEKKIFLLSKTSLSTISVLLIALLFSFIRSDVINDAYIVTDEIQKLNVAVVQGNIGQAEKWDDTLSRQNFDTYLDLSKNIKEKVDLIVWPESSMPYQIQEREDIVKELMQVARYKQTTFAIGADTFTGTKNVNAKYFNSLLIIDGEKGITHQYDKFHLVPFGEYIPFRNILPKSIDVMKLTAGDTDITPGKGLSILDWNNLKLAPLICYESIFPRHSRQLAQMGADVLLNISNDAWFGEAAKPQHLVMSMLRAIENRRPLIRVSNTGITSVFDAAGNSIANIPSNQVGVAIATIPLLPIAAFNSNYGGYFVLLCLIFYLLTLLYSRRVFVSN